MWLDTLEAKHYRALYEIAKRAEPFCSDISYEEFEGTMSKREGFVVVANDGTLAGAITFSDFVPETNIVIHCVIGQKHQRRWCSRKNLAMVADYVYNQLDLPRMSGFCIVGSSDKAGQFLSDLGFVQEGNVRKGAKLPDGYHDLRLFGMLKEECRWLKGNEGKAG